MADILIDNQTVPSTPSSGKSVMFIDSTTKKLCVIDDTGRITGNLSRNDTTASQTLAASDTYVTNSGILIPSFGMKAGQLFRWTITLSKTNAGTAAAVVAVRVGSGQSTSDTTRLTLTQAAAEAQSALVASAVLIVVAGVRNVSASGVLAGGFGFTQTYQATAGNLAFGGGNDAASSTFDNSAMAGLYAGLSINAGASSAWTITHLAAELIG
jgi:hypothetical protein